MLRALCLPPLVCLVALGACGSEEAASEVPKESDASDDVKAPPLQCPLEGPQEGVSCTEPEGTTCAADSCDDTYVSCRRGVWTASTVPAPEVLCPGAVPTDGEACPRCFPATIVCSYGCPNSPTGSRAVCVRQAKGNALWRITTRECPTFDAGPDAEDGS